VPLKGVFKKKTHTPGGIQVLKKNNFTLYEQIYKMMVHDDANISSP